MIKSIELTNWKSHQHSVLDFEKGTNVLIGVAGAGKSSVMDAISYALYGTFPALKSKKVSIAETIMNKPVKTKQAKIKLKFDYNNKEFEIERNILLKGVNQATLRENEKIIAGPKPREVNEKIIELLKIDFDLFSKAIYSEQNNLDAFLKMSPSQRKNKFDELLQINKYETIRSNCLTTINRMKKINEERKKIVEEQKKRINEKEINELKTKIILKEKEIIEKKTKLTELKEKENKEKKTIQEQELKEKKFRELNNSLKTLEGKIESKENELKTIIEETKKNPLEKIKQELNEIITVLELAPEQKKIKNNELKQLVENYEEELKKTSELKARENQLIESKQKLSKVTANCPICRKPLNEHSKTEIMKEYLKEINDLEKKQEEKRKKLAELKKAREEKTREIDLIMEKEKELLQKKQEIMQKIEKQELKTLKEKELNELKQEKKELNELLQKNDFDEQKFGELKKEFYSIKEKTNSIQKEIDSIKEIIIEMNKRVKEMNEFKKSYQELELKISKTKKNSEKLNIFMNSLKQTQNELRIVLIESINSAMDTIWEQVYPYKDFKTAKIIVKDGEYEVMVKNNENEFVRVEGILSGGERTAVAITLRIAFSLVLTRNLGWIILDEPTHNLDSKSVKELTKMLREHLPKIVEQVFVITHNNEMKTATTGKLYLLERKKEEFESTNIIELNSF